MLCSMETCHPKQHIILLSHTTTNYREKALLNDTRNIHTLLKLHHHMLCLSNGTLHVTVVNTKLNL